MRAGHSGHTLASYKAGRSSRLSAAAAAFDLGPRRREGRGRRTPAGHETSRDASNGAPPWSTQREWGPRWRSPSQRPGRIEERPWSTSADGGPGSPARTPHGQAAHCQPAGDDSMLRHTARRHRSRHRSLLYAVAVRAQGER